MTRGAGSLQRTIVVGGGIGFVITTVAVTVGVALNGGGGASIGAGLMVAGFDGFPFGAPCSGRWSTSSGTPRTERHS